MEVLLVLVLVLVLLGAIYFLPTIIAARRHARRLGAVFVLNLFLGWTLIGWVVALVWAVGDNTKAQTETNYIEFNAPENAAGRVEKGAVVRFVKLTDDSEAWRVESEHGPLGTITGDEAHRIGFWTDTRGKPAAKVHYVRGVGADRMIGLALAFGPTTPTD